MGKKNSTPQEAKTTQTMIGSNLTNHLSDKLATHIHTQKHANKQQNLFCSVLPQMRQKEEKVSNSLLPIQIGVKGENKKSSITVYKMSVGYYAEANSELKGEVKMVTSDLKPRDGAC